MRNYYKQTYNHMKNTKILEKFFLSKLTQEEIGTLTSPRLLTNRIRF